SACASSSRRWTSNVGRAGAEREAARGLTLLPMLSTRGRGVRAEQLVEARHRAELVDAVIEACSFGAGERGRVEAGSAHHHEPHRTRRKAYAQPPRNLVTVDSRHMDVEDDELGLPFLGQLERLDTIGRELHFVA